MPTSEPALTTERLAQARTMLDTFASVGATHFDVTLTDADGKVSSLRIQLEPAVPAIEFTRR